MTTSDRPVVEMEGQSISAAVISTDANFRSVFAETAETEHPVKIEFEIVVPFVEVSHGHLEELRYVDPDIIFLDLEEDPVLGCKLAQFLAEANPNRRLIATGEKQSPEFLMTVMQAGISEYLPKPVTADALLAAIGRTSRKMGGRQEAQGPVNREPGKLLAFFSAKGGSGSTTVSTNLAIQIHRLTGKRTVVVDLDLELGEIALFLGVEPRFSFIDLARNFHRMDAGLLASFIECHDTGVHLLSAPYYPEKSEAVSGEEIRQILMFLKQHYEYVVVDTSNSFTPQTMAAFEQADEIYMVANIDVPSLRNIQRTQHLLQNIGKGATDFRLVVNRYHPDNEITLDDVERSLDMDIYWALPNDYESVIYSINAGHPVILDDSSRYTHELEALTAKITGLPGAMPRRRGWFSRTVDRVKDMVGTEGQGEETLMLPPAVAGGEGA